MVKKIFRLYGIIFMTAILFMKVYAAEKKPLDVPLVEGNVKVDGMLEEELWQQALKLELKFEVYPGANIPPPVRTEVFIAHNKTKFFIAFRAYDPSPSSIRARFTDRDNISEDDRVGISLDTFNDQRRVYTFICNPFGIQAEAVESNRESNYSWDAIWASAGRIDKQGYIVEMSIPFSSLRFQRKKQGQLQVWGFDAFRSYPRNIDRTLGLIPRDRNNNCYYCQLEKIIGFKHAKAGKNIEIDPSVSTLVTREREDFPGGKWVKKDSKLDPGITAHWGFTPNMTLSAAINPDFSNVEADVAQLDINTRFALFYPEKRPFFLEGASIFTTPLPIVYTRSLADPDWGIKLTGKAGQHTLGFYSGQDNITNLVFPGSQVSASTSLDKKTIGTVLRYRLDLGAASTVGLLLTDREGSEYFNRTGGIDAHLRLNRKKQVKIQALASWTRYPEQVASGHGQPFDRFTGTALDLFFRHESKTLGYYAGYRQVSPNFRADLGYMPQVDYRNAGGGFIFAWWGGSDKWYTFINLQPSFEYKVDFDNHLLNKNVKIASTYYGPGQSVFITEGKLEKQSFMGNLFDTGEGLFYFSIQPSGSLQLWLGGIFGKQIDFANTRQGDRVFINPGFGYKAGRYFSVNLDHIFEHLEVDAGGLYTANVSNLRIVYQFSRRAFLRTILQYVHYDYNTENYTFSLDPEYKHLFTQVLFSYRINPQTMLFLGYSDDYYGFQHIPLKQANHTLFLKIGYALVL